MPPSLHKQLQNHHTTCSLEFFSSEEAVSNHCLEKKEPVEFYAWKGQEKIFWLLCQMYRTDEQSEALQEKSNMRYVGIFSHKALDLMFFVAQRILKEGKAETCENRYGW